jgi:hypothetical protein
MSWNSFTLREFLGIEDIKEFYKVEELNEYLRLRADKEGLSENYLDGHGYEIRDGRTVFVIDGHSVVFELDDSHVLKEKWFYRTLNCGPWIKWKDSPKYQSKMKSRF